MTSLPTGIVTFLFTDIEGSTKMWEHHADAMKIALARHDALLRDAIENHRGYVFKTVGDAFCAAFSTALDGLNAAVAAQRALNLEFGNWELGVSLRARMGLHTGSVEERDGDYFGRPLNRVARLFSSGHGGQTLLSLATAELVRDHLPEHVTLRDLGEHHLKDLERPERIYQVVAPDLAYDFPPLKTLDTFRNNLPIQLTSIVGRETEIAQVKQLFTTTRLLTLTGPGGTGKTRLALQVAADLIEEFQDGAFFVPLSSIHEPGLVMLTLIQIVGIKETIGLSIMEDLENALRDKQMLLVLDNFEHVTDAAPLIGELLSACPRLRILVTSREVLHLRGEYEFPVPPLSLPDPNRLPMHQVLSQYAAVALFIQRALAVKPDFSVTNENAPAVAEICARVDGLPLAIELAAARVKLLSPQAMLKRLENRLTFLTGGARDLPTRQQTLRNTIDWSYDLLDQTEQTLFCRVAVFVGGCTLEAVEHICGAEQSSTIAVLDILSALLDQSLLRQMEVGGESRFRMLHVLREYALERLAASGAMEAVRQKHADYFLAFAEQADLQLEGSEQLLWLERLQREHDNLRAAIDWYAHTAQAEPGLRLASALWRFWEIRGHLTEGRARLAQMLELPESRRHPHARMQALYAAGVLADAQCDYPAARTLFEENVELHRAIGSPASIATALNNLGNVAIIQGDYARVHSCYIEALEISRQLSDPIGIAWALKGLGQLAERQGDLVAARALYDESLTAFQQHGIRGQVATVLNDLGRVANAQGDLTAAHQSYERVLNIFREMDNQGAVAIALNNLANVATIQGDYPAARASYEQGLALVQTLDDKRGLARALEGFAGLAMAQAQPDRAIRLLASAAALRETIGAPLASGDQTKVNHVLEIATQSLSPAEFAAHFAAGQAQSLEQAVAYALEGGALQPTENKQI